MSEPQHVYQNRADTYPLEAMYLCEACNGYYGVPHDFDHEEHLKDFTSSMYPGDGRYCACRFHREENGLPREGDFGWLLENADL